MGLNTCLIISMPTLYPAGSLTSSIVPVSTRICGLRNFLKKNKTTSSLAPQEMRNRVCSWYSKKVGSRDERNPPSRLKMNMVMAVIAEEKAI
jgi:hypothetical protein